MAHEVVNFVQLLGYHEVCLRGDNEGAMRRLLRVITAARMMKVGLPTKVVTARDGGHSNSLVENAIQRVRSLAGSLMHQLQSKVNQKFTSSHGIGLGQHGTAQQVPAVQGCQAA